MEGAEKPYASDLNFVFYMDMLTHDLTPIRTTFTGRCTLQNASCMGIVEYKLHWLLMKWDVGNIQYKDYVEINLN